VTQIIPAILATTEEEYAEQLSKIEDSGDFTGGWVHIDLMDNKFVQNTSIRPEIIAKHPADLKLEAHLMVEYPENWIDQLVKISIDRIIFPVEDSSGIEDRIEHIKGHEIAVGLAINPETDIQALEPFIELIDLVLVMGVHPGKQGQQFIPETIDKVRQLSKMREENSANFTIEVDGGISPDNAKLVKDAGASYLVIGSHLTKGDIDENLAEIWEKLS